MPTMTAAREITDIGAAALLRMTPLERVVLSLFYKENLSTGEIALVLEIGEADVAHLHAKALGRMRTEILPEQRRAA
jgi:DNA-directed RNA polymerase specialized sigma subunit